MQGKRGKKINIKTVWEGQKFKKKKVCIWWEVSIHSQSEWIHTDCVEVDLRVGEPCLLRRTDHAGW